MTVTMMQCRLAACALLSCLAYGAQCAASAPLPLSDSDRIVLGDFADSRDAAVPRALREALRAALDESPYLNLVPDAAIEKLLGGRSVALPARERAQLCQSLGARVYLSGTLTRAAQGGAFAGQLSAVDCARSAQLAHEEFAAETSGLVDALGAAAVQMRLDLGESRASVLSFSTPLSQSTSASLDALATWSSALGIWRKEGAAAAVPLLHKALGQDPTFAAATFDLGLAYRNSGQEELARESFTRAYGMRARASVRRALTVAAQYHAFVTVDESRAVESFRAWSTSYPRDYKAVSNLGSFYGDICRYPEALAQFERARRMNPADVVPHEDLMEMLVAVGDFQGARAVYRDIRRLNLDDDSPHLYLYVIAALESNTAEMAQQVAWFADKKDLQHEMLSEQADAAAYSGQLAEARRLSARAVASARTAGNLEQAASWLLNSAWREDLLGEKPLAHEQAVQALTIAPASREGEATAAIILARTGDIARVEALLADIEQRYPDHRVMQSYWLPTIRAQLALKRADASAALKELATAAPLDLIYPQVFFYSHMPSVLLRAEAYTLAGDPAGASREWQTILSHPGITQLSATAPYARVQLARGNAGVHGSRQTAPRD